MKTKLRNLKSLLLAMCLLVAAVSVSGLAGPDLLPVAKAYAAGDQILYGTYPQSRVTDAALISQLDAAPKAWRSYGYYSRIDNADEDNTVSSDYMRFADFFFGGNKYRAVTFSGYRPYYTNYRQTPGDSFQDENGYRPQNLYYFLYEPIQWRVLDPEDGLILSEAALDAQAYQNTVIQVDFEYWRDAAASAFACDYAASSIRAWLNSDFYETAFTDAQKNNIRNDVALNNDSPYDDAYHAAATQDKIFLLSFSEASDSAYGFSSLPSGFDLARIARGTDYAKCQGLYVGDTGDSWWWLRSPGRDSRSACIVIAYGFANNNSTVNHTGHGIRPVCRLTDLDSDIALSPALFSGTTGGLPCGHVWSDGELIKKATCADAGEMRFACKLCGETKTEPLDKDPANHTGGTEIRDAVGATCGADGYSGDTYCKGCGKKLYSGDAIPATGEHTWNGGEITAAATCAAAGEKIYTCTVCGAKRSPAEVIPKTDAHTFGEWTVTKEATVTAAGEKERVCTVCGQKENEEIAKLPDAAPQYLPGDVNQDGKVTAADARLALRRAVGLETYAEGSVRFLAADVSFDGKITASDARRILRAAVGLETL